MRKFMLVAAVLAAFSSLEGCSNKEAAVNTMNVDETLAVDNVVEADNAVAVDAANAVAAHGGPTVPAPDEPIFCAAIHDQTTRADCARIGMIRDNLAVGSSGVRYPPEITRGDTVTISFAVTNDPQATPTETMLGAKPVQEATLKVGRRMAAQLSGEGFKIEPEGLQQRDLYIAQGATWDWKVTALKAPTHQLKISAYVVIPDKDGALKENLLKTLDLPLQVKVTTGQRIGDWMDSSVDWMTRGTNWLKVLALFIAAALSVWGLLKRKGKAPAEPPAKDEEKDDKPDF